MSKIYKQGDQCTFTEDMEEYQNLKEFSDLLTKLSPNNYTYIVRDVYLDIGQDWMWTTICNKEKGYQAISPREWFEIVNREKSYEDIAKDYFEDKYCIDKPKKNRSDLPDIRRLIDKDVTHSVFKIEFHKNTSDDIILSITSENTTMPSFNRKVTMIDQVGREILEYIADTANWV